MIFSTGCIQDKEVNQGNSSINCYFGKLPSSLDILQLNDNSYKGIFSYLFTGLVTVDKSGKIVPSIAEDWNVSTDGLKYTFKLKSNAYWSDGEEITAENFVELFKMLLDKDRKDSLKYMLYPIVNAENYAKGSSSFDKVGVKANDEKTLEINLSKVCPDFIKILSQQDFYLRKDKENLENWQKEYKTMKFSGPYSIVKIDNNELQLDKNSYYWDSDSIKCKRFFIMKDMSHEEALAYFEMGDIDVMVNPPISEVNRFISNSNTIIVNSTDTLYLTFNTVGSSQCSNVLLRKKIANAIDRKQIKNNSLKDFQSDTYGIFKEMQGAGYNDLGNTNNDKSINLKLVCSDDDISKKISQEIGAELKKSLKINLSVTALSNEELEKEKGLKDFDIVLGRSFSSYNNQFDICRNFVTGNLENVMGYSNKDMDSLVINSIYGDDNSSKKAQQQCYDILYKDAMYVPLFKDVELILKSSELSDISVGYFGEIQVDNLSK